VDTTGGPNVSVSRTIAAPAAEIFAVLADPSRHAEFDGSRMVRAAVGSRPVTAVGDVFVMEMYYGELGEYLTRNRVVEFVPDRKIAWEPAPGDEQGALAAGVTIGEAPGHRWIYELRPLGPASTEVVETYDCSRATDEVTTAIDHGRAWLTSMTRSLERLDALCTEPIDR
jgi:uncharacterized protein YndB with AHSA1/START domain